MIKKQRLVCGVSILLVCYGIKEYERLRERALIDCWVVCPVVDVPMGDPVTGVSQMATETKGIGGCCEGDRSQRLAGAVGRRPTRGFLVVWLGWHPVKGIPEGDPIVGVSRVATATKVLVGAVKAA